MSSFSQIRLGASQSMPFQVRAPYSSSSQTFARSNASTASSTLSSSHSIEVRIVTISPFFHGRRTRPSVLLCLPGRGHAVRGGFSDDPRLGNGASVAAALEERVRQEAPWFVGGRIPDGLGAHLDTSAREGGPRSGYLHLQEGSASPLVGHHQPLEPQLGDVLDSVEDLAGQPVHLVHRPVHGAPPSRGRGIR